MVRRCTIALVMVLAAPAVSFLLKNRSVIAIAIDTAMIPASAKTFPSIAYGWAPTGRDSRTWPRKIAGGGCHNLLRADQDRRRHGSSRAYFCLAPVMICSHPGAGLPAVKVA
jgi:hypothetical protein